MYFDYILTLAKLKFLYIIHIEKFLNKKCFLLVLTYISMSIAIVTLLNPIYKVFVKWMYNLLKKNKNKISNVKFCVKSKSKSNSNLSSNSNKKSHYINRKYKNLNSISECECCENYSSHEPKSNLKKKLHNDNNKKLNKKKIKFNKKKINSILGKIELV